jgi:hypothetical protein
MPVEHSAFSVLNGKTIVLSISLAVDGTEI